MNIVYVIGRIYLSSLIIIAEIIARHFTGTY